MDVRLGRKVFEMKVSGKLFFGGVHFVIHDTRMELFWSCLRWHVLKIPIEWIATVSSKHLRKSIVGDFSCVFLIFIN